MKCHCCGCDVDEFADGTVGLAQEKGSVCPKCQCLSRHRLLVYALDNYLLPGKKNISLEISYTAHLHDKLVSLSEELYLVDLIRRTWGPNVNILCNIQASPFKSNVFDLILCSDALEHVQDDVAVLNECYRILKPNGILFVHVPLDAGWDGATGTPKEYGAAEYHRNSKVMRCYSRTSFEKRVLETTAFITQCLYLQRPEFRRLSGNPIPYEVVFLLSKEEDNH